MPKKGFTLVELLAVIVILAIILSIAIPSITNVINNVQLDAYAKNEQMLAKAAKTYVEINDISLPATVGGTTEVTLNTLQSGGFISAIKDPIDKSTTCNGYVLITKTSSSYDYTPYLNCNVNIGNISSDGLIGYWKLDDGVALDYTPNNRTGTVSNATATTNRFNVNNKAINFDGVNSTSASKIDDNLVYERNTQYTLTAWVYRRSDKNFQFIVGGKVGNNLAMGLIAGDSQRLVFHTYDTTDKDLLSSNTGAFKLNEWSHVAATVKYTSQTGDVVAGDIVLYVNGARIKSGSFSNVTIFTRTMNIGSPDVNNYDRAFNGVIDNVRVYNRVLSDDEIKHMYDIEKLKD